jgi:mannitol/fructose-specific phosphotransferase system IIA component (Ntr-type)
VIPAHEASTLSERDADLVISTVPLPDCSINSVVISAIPHERDYQKVSKKISELSYLTWRRRNSTNSSGQDASASLKSVISKISDLLYREFPERYYQLMPKVDTILRSNYYSSSTRGDQGEGESRLHQLLTKEFIELDVSCTDWKDSIKASGHRLVDGGYCSDEYVKATIRNVEELGPYIVISKGFALPHESADKGAFKLGMSLVRLKSPVCFGVEELDPVRYVCMLATIDDTAHLRALFDLMNCLKLPEFLAMFDNAKTPKEEAGVIYYFESRAAK